MLELPYLFIGFNVSTFLFLFFVERMIHNVLEKSLHFVLDIRGHLKINVHFLIYILNGAFS